MNKSIKKNYIYNLLYQILAIILPLLTTPYLARVLGAHGTGIYGYTISIVTYFILMGTLGITTYGQREIACLQNSKNNRNKLFTELVILRICTMLISSLVFFLIFGLHGKYVIYFRILLLELLANALDISWFYQGLEEFKKIVLRNFIIKILSAISIFLFVKTKNDLSNYIIIFSLTTLLGNVSLWFRLNKYVKFDFCNLNFKKHIKPILILFIPQIAIQIYTVLDKPMLGFILNDMNEVGYYEQAQKIVKILLTIITSLGTVMLSRIASCYANGDNDKINTYMKKSFSFTFFLTFPMLFGIIAVTGNLVPVFLGNNYDTVEILLPVMTLLIIFIGIGSLTGTQFLLPAKKSREYNISVICGAIINVILNLLLIPNFKSLGATIATIIAEFCVTSIQIYFVQKYLNIKNYFKQVTKYLIAAIIMFGICMLINLLPLNNLYMIIVKTITGGLVYLIVLLILKDSFLLELIYSIKNILLKKKN